MYLTHKDLSNYYCLDIETDGLKPTRIWCVVIRNIGTNEVWKFNDAEGTLSGLGQFVQDRPEAIWVGHNLISYDAPALDALAGIVLPLHNIVDTLVLSYLYNPALDGGHSLKSYGIRLGFPKGDHSDWSQFSPEMLEYCERDVDLTCQVFLILSDKMRKIGYSELSCKIEHRIRHVIDKQQRNGFWFDREGAEHLLGDLRRRQADLSEQIQSLFPATLTPLKEYSFRRLKSGEPSLSFRRHEKEYDAIRFNDDETKYTVYQYRDFNLGSPKQRVERLLSLGWVPDQYTEKGSPKIDEDSLVRYATSSGRAEIQALADWLVLQGRSTMIEGWLTNCNPSDSRIHGEVFTCGATTRRMRHRKPNTANIPTDANKAAYGHECRALWGIGDKENRRLVGYDAAGLEMRGFCHYLNDPVAAKLYIEGDPHQFNADNLTKALGFEVIRGGGGAKTIFYAFLYGAGDKKLGTILKMGPDVGAIVRETLVKTTPGLDRLTKEIEREFRRNNGMLLTIDGGWVRCPSPHASLNYKIQSAGGIVMKLASVLLDKEIEDNEWDALKVGDIHDEAQLDVAREVADVVGAAGVDCIERAGRELDFKVPLTGEYKVGLNWSETH